jgi:hypothetical protein
MAADEFDAYSLLSKDPREVTDAEAEQIIADLRRRRAAYIKTGKPDKPAKEKVEAVKLDKDEKARNTAALLAQLKLPGQS